ncbi:chloride channel CLIC-like protein 1 isoform X1 [Dicentrarchus labrax]|uniref:Chloride channel CLIC-like protein 1 n=1 Tax=Dicentrarchus labrax TaxID=13489 RepID=A0A8C4IT41_DICLA|nr:chloride channel CLIC-like protein 1 isoform X1 [Dicentrarchus labrax]
MLLSVLVCSFLLAATGQQVDDEWIDPYDMLNYDATTKTMKKPAEPEKYSNVPTKRREYTQDSDQKAQCDRQVVDLKNQIEEQKKRITLISQQPTCTPVFKRFLSRLLKEIQRVGLPSDSTDVHYDAKIKLSRQSMTEIQTLLDGEDSWRTGALDNAISQILVDLKPHDYEAWRWRFEDSFGVEIDTVIKIGLFVLILVAIISTQLWSTVSWFVQFRRMMGVSFFVSIIWNWFYLYKIAFAEHQSKMAKMDGINEKCTGMKKIDWSDSLKEWFRSTWTLQDDPCKKYYELLMVNPILLVPPTKAISVTITTFITEPLKHFGKGISEFLRALLQDLPITLQIPVLITIVLSIVVCMYGGVQAAFQHGITAPFRRRRRDPPPPPQLQQPQRHLQGIEDYDDLAGGDAPQRALRHRADDGRLHRNQVHRRRPNRPREEPAKVVVETLHTAEPPYSEDEPDAQLREEEQDLYTESESDNQQETQEELTGATASLVAADTAQSKTEPTESENKSMDVKENISKDDGAASKSQPARRRSSQTDVQHGTCANGMENIHIRHKLDPPASAEDRTSSASSMEVETVGVPVQESSPAIVE